MRRFQATLFAPALAALLWSTASGAAPKYVRLSYTGDTQTTITVSWNTTVSAASEVQYGTSSGSYTTIVSGKSVQANAGLGYIHEVTLTGLSPSTWYFYRAGSNSDGFSQPSSFKTGPTEDPSCGSVKFVFLADNRPDPLLGGGENWPQILAQAAAQGPAFTLNGGDLVIDGDQIDQWLAFLGWTEPVAKKIAFMPAIGNHDVGPGSGNTANYNQIFALPSSSGTGASGTEDHYFFTYANAIFVALSTDTFTGGSTPFANQAAWLDQVLTNNPKKWKFVYFHKPSYTTEVFFSISHPPNEANQNAALVPVFDKHHVDIVFNSHNHWYERFEPSACATKGNPGSDNPCPVGASNFAGGTVYIVSGGAGAFTIPGVLCGSTAGRAKCLDSHHYVLVEIQNEKLKLETWGAAPQPSQLLDGITITKAADVCAAPDAGAPDSGSAGSGGVAGSAGSGSAGDSGSAGVAGANSGGNSGTSSGGSSGTNTGGSSGTPSGGSAGSSGGTTGGGGSSTGGAKSTDSGDDSGCGCRVAGGAAPPGLLLGLLGLAALRRRRRR